MQQMRIDRTNLNKWLDDKYAAGYAAGLEAAAKVAERVGQIIYVTQGNVFGAQVIAARIRALAEEDRDA